MSDEQPVVLKNFKKNIAVIQEYIRCIIHYDRNVMEKEKEVGKLTDASFCTIDDL